MQSPVSRYMVLVKRWLWMVLIGMVLCCGATYLVSKLTHPVYQASAWLVVNLDMTTASNTTSSLAAVPTYAQLVTNPTVLGPVADHYRGMTVSLLSSKLTVKPQSNTQLIEVDVQDGNPVFATQLANEVSQSFIRYANAQLPGTVQLLPAQQPTQPFKPKPIVNTEIAALVSLALSIFLIIVFEWIDDRPTSADEIRRLLGARLLAVLPLFVDKTRRRKKRSPELSVAYGPEASMLAEKYHMLCAGLTAELSAEGGKLVLVTSALAGEGKSAIACRLAAFLAQTGKKVLLVDANLHRPVQAERFHVQGALGLSQLLLRSVSDTSNELPGTLTHIPNLHVLPAGYTPARPAELLQSPMARSFFERLQLAAFDFVIIDAPPLLPVADAQIMATAIQTVLLVVDAHKTPRRTLVRAREELHKAHATLLGVVVNKSRWPDDTRELEYPDDFEPGLMGNSGPVPAVFSTPSSQVPAYAARQKRKGARPSDDDTSSQTKGRP